MKITLQNNTLASSSQSTLAAEDSTPFDGVALVQNPLGLALMDAATGIRRWLYQVLGGFFVALAALGAVLPILPTTPFLLLACWFFMRSNPALRDRLLSLPAVGLLLHDWEKHRAVRPKTKWTVYFVVPCTITASIVGGELSWPTIAILCSLGVIGVGIVWRLPVIRNLESDAM